MVPTVAVFAQHLALAGVLGAVIGLERQWNQGMAGLRTNALVATAAAAFISLPALLQEEGSGPAHMAASIITGIGFLGTGVILREGGSVRGLNTAATLWASASVGAFAGAGLRVHAAVIAIGILTVNVGMRPVVYLVNRTGARFGRGSPISYQIELCCDAARQRHVRALLLHRLQAARLAMRGLAIKDLPGSAATILADVIAYGSRDLALEQLVGELAADPAIRSAQWSMRDSLEADPSLHLGS